MFKSLTQAEASILAALHRLDPSGGDDAQLALEAFNYVMNECIRRGRARLVYSSGQSDDAKAALLQHRQRNQERD